MVLIDVRYMQQTNKLGCYLDHKQVLDHAEKSATVVIMPDNGIVKKLGNPVVCDPSKIYANQH